MKHFKAAWDRTMIQMSTKHCEELLAEGSPMEEAIAVATAYQQRVEGYTIGWLWGFLMGACSASIIIWLWRMFL